MPKPISDDELQLKVRARRRILGAVTLVVILVLVLPMVLDSQPKRDAQDVAIKIPAPDKAPPFNSQLRPAPTPEISAPPPKLEPVPSDVKPVPSGEAVNAVTKATPTEIRPLAKAVEKPKAAEPEKASSNKKAPESAKLANSKSAKFAVQLGVFSNVENAQLVEGRLSENKIRHYRQMLKSPPGAVRVRAGPYPSRKEAETALTQLKLAGISGGVVVSE